MCVFDGVDTQLESSLLAFWYLTKFDLSFLERAQHVSEIE